MNKVWRFFNLGGIIGSVIAYLLYLLLTLMFAGGAKFFFCEIGGIILLIIGFLPAILTGFIPYGLLGILTLFIIRKYSAIVSLKKLRLYLIFLGLVYPLVLTVVYAFGLTLLGLVRSTITLNEALSASVSITKYMFSMNGGSGGFIPSFPNLFNMLIFLTSGMSVSLILLNVFIRENKNNASTTNSH
ncbi:MAG: hypothetical protein Q8O13_04005 [Candidatus Omnitrophota bacterium]|nr:hypothetical protein [Candidatus Omnitrophota bacterium]